MIKSKLILMLCAIGITFSLSTKVLASNNTQRIWGNDRYATAIEVSKNGWTNGSEYAVLANGENFPDALSAAPLAKKYNAPILLNPGATLDIRVENELKRLGVKQVFIIGGSAVVPDTVKNKLEKLNIKTTRLWGQDRYETSIKIAEQLGFNGQVAVANGENFPDALSISPIAAQKSMPVILTPSNTLPNVVAKYIKDNKISKSYIIGENDVVNDKIASSFPNSERIWGSNKYDTNIAVLKRFENELNFNKIYIANGENFPDALAGSAIAAKDSTCVLLLSDHVGQATKDFMRSNITSNSNINILGGNAVMPNEQIDNILYVTGNAPGNTQGNTNGNLSFGGIAAKEGQWIYYTDGYGRLYKSKDDGSSTIKLIDIQEDAASPSRISDINVLGEWIYYNEGYDINKIKIDGTSKTKIDQGFLLAVIGNTVYYTSTDRNSLCKVNIDGSEKTTLNEKLDNNMLSLNISGDWIYYINVSDNNEIYKMKLDGSNKIKVRDEAVQQMIIDNGFIYYSVNGGVYRMKPDNSDVVCIVNNHNNGVTFNVSGDWIYYTMGEDNLYKIKSDGSGNVKVADVNAFKLTPGTRSIFFPTIVGDWIYYECDVHTPGDDYFTYKCKVKTNGSENSIIDPKYR